MAQELTAVNGTFYNVAITSLKVTANVTDSDKAGRSVAGLMIRDVIGTYLQVAMELTMKEYDEASFASLIEVLRQPTDSVTLTVRDVTGMVTFEAYVTKVEYEYQGFLSGAHRWGGLKVTFTPMAPNIKP